ncbi:MAG TPA: isoprenylcysteine carboxylmethyltransferase family protein, partial [Solirubrobacteraceae bacterium]|nr:isoprenylcysteine carboxylmethyltransferase family protein [Solirubrobacteraceae bacterium]
MNTLRIAVGIAWVAFWIYWFASAWGVKAGARPSAWARSRLLIVIVAIVVVRIVHPRGWTFQSWLVDGIGAALFVCGVAVAIWARVNLGRNWGMPMTTKQEPELVTSGPYQFVRHPIYSGLLLAILGTTLLTNIIGLVIVAAFAATFYYSALVEERNL